MTRETVTRRSVALSLASLECWPALDHDMRRFAYETVSTMQRLAVPPVQYEQFLTWLMRDAARRDQRQ
jgi:hypothetical protein